MYLECVAYILGIAGAQPSGIGGSLSPIELRDGSTSECCAQRSCEETLQTKRVLECLSANFTNSVVKRSSRNRQGELDISLVCVYACVLNSYTKTALQPRYITRVYVCVCVRMCKYLEYMHLSSGVR